MPAPTLIKISTSQRSMLQECEQKYVYGVVQNLTKKVAPVPMTRGLWFHLMLHAHYLDREIRPGLRGWKGAHQFLTERWVENIPADERERMGDLPEEARRLMEAYLYHWTVLAADTGSEEFETVAVEEKCVLEIEDPKRNRVYQITATVDLIGKDRDGNLFIMETKTGKNFPYNAPMLSVEPQLSLQMLAARASGYEVQYGVYNYVKATPPSVPEVLKDGSRLSAKACSTDYRTMMKAIRAAGLDPRDYKDRLDALRDPQGSEFFRRVLVGRSDRIMFMQARDTVQEAKRGYRLTMKPKQATRHINKFLCEQFCMFKDLCFAELYNVNAVLTREKYYEQRVDDRDWLFIVEESD